MAKNKTRRFPVVLSTLCTVSAVAAAVYYKRQNDYLLEADPGVASISFPAELMEEVRNGATLMYWQDASGKQCFRTTNEVSH